MDRRSRIIVGLFVTALLAIILTEILRPKPLNWRPSFTSFDTVPFGCYVLFQELNSLFRNMEIKAVEDTPYNALVSRDETVAANYVFINSSLAFDEQETNQLLSFVEEGNTVFMAANYFGRALSDSLNVYLNSDYSVQEDTVHFTLHNRRFQPGGPYPYSRGLYKSHFTSVDSLNTTILGEISFEKNDLLSDKTTEFTAPNFIEIKYGQGSFFLHANPVAFTNFYLLEGDQNYVANAFSYLSDRPLWWDTYKKDGRIIVDSPMRFVLNQSALKWAYYLTVCGLIIFVIFKAKREQRIIPVIEPLENSSVEFARTVGSLYFQHKDYSDLIAKKMNYFLEYLRSQYYMDTSRLSEKTIRDLAAKSGKSLTETKELIEYIAYLKGKAHHSENELIELNKKITVFKQ